MSLKDQNEWDEYCHYLNQGVVGVEERLMLLWSKAVATGRITREQFVSLVSAMPAKLLNIYPQKGRLEVGSDADIVIWDPRAKRTLGKEDHQSKCDFNIFEGTEVQYYSIFLLYTLSSFTHIHWKLKL